MHKRLVFNIISKIILLASCFLLLPLGVASYDNLFSVETNAFVVSIAVVLLVALLGQGFFFSEGRSSFDEMNAKDALACVGLVWLVLSVLGALPLWLSGVVPCFTDAFFEIASGFTTTGASIFTEVESLPRGILFWRSLTHWIGGMGVIVLYVALLPAFGGKSFQLYKAESSGLTVERAVPRLRESAKRLWIIYVFFSALCFLLLFFGGMPVFDALCHTFGAIATGGFSTKNASIGAYGPYAQWVIIVFMFLGGVNFLLHYRLFLGRPKAFFRDEELRFFSGFVLFFTAMFAFVLWKEQLGGAPVRDAAFQVVSIVTATGFATADFDLWPDLLKGSLLFFMFVGGCAGSTSGGLKMIRMLLVTKFSFKAVSKAIFPNAVIPVRLNGKMLSEKMTTSVLTYFVIFVLLIFLGTFLILVFDSTDMVTAVSAVLSAISSVGPGLGAVGPTQNFAWMSLPGKWVLIFLMLAGRLEMYAFLILFIPSTWKK